MFGYVTINKPELRFREYDLYQSYYCGLCLSLKEKYGIAGQLTLGYDMTFLILLLTDLYEPENIEDCKRCIAHPLSKHYSNRNACTEYASAMNIIVSYYKCMDDWLDERKKSSRLYAAALKKGFKNAVSLYPQKASAIESHLKELSEYETANSDDLDGASGCFGRLMGEIFSYRQDQYSEWLKLTGFYLGKFIYLMDAYDDLEKDIKSGSYNVLKSRASNEDFDERCEELLTMMLDECTKNYEKLPVLNYSSILRNILYSGIWTKFETVKAKRHGSI